MARFHFLIVFNIVDQNGWNTKQMEISHRAAPASIVLFKSNCTKLFIINGSNMRERMMEESQISRNVVKTILNKMLSTGWTRKRRNEKGSGKKINTTKCVKGA